MCSSSVGTHPSIPGGNRQFPPGNADRATRPGHLQARATGSPAVDVPGGSPQLQGGWALLGGVDLNGALLAHLRMFGTPLIEGRLPLPAFHREWPLPAGSLPSARP
ncbi:hypothetical protein [Kitasatospora sp. NPDC002965]|uniref:hypothetical protein n=1 Tax=Kitasatospora sp. NPDC002965 TaxID=3154775 RepID=UPI0033B432A3